MKMHCIELTIKLAVCVEFHQSQYYDCAGCDHDNSPGPNIATDLWYKSEMKYWPKLYSDIVYTNFLQFNLSPYKQLHISFPCYCFASGLLDYLGIQF